VTSCTSIFVTTGLSPSSPKSLLQTLIRRRQRSSSRSHSGRSFLRLTLTFQWVSPAKTTQNSPGANSEMTVM
jgi:hypothetical protein